MYHIHTTPGFIIEARAYGEADKILSIFTRELGLVQASARGIRLERSKLRYQSQELMTGTFSLVRGKEYWRLTSAQAGNSAAASAVPQELAARIALLLRRLLHGEEAHPELYEIVDAALVFARTHPDLSREEFQTLESVAVLRILNVLGYIGKRTDILERALTMELTVNAIDALMPERTAINREINKALKESQL